MENNGDRVWRQENRQMGKEIADLKAIQAKNGEELAALQESWKRTDEKVDALTARMEQFLNRMEEPTREVVREQDSAPMIQESVIPNSRLVTPQEAGQASIGLPIESSRTTNVTAPQYVMQPSPAMPYRPPLAGAMQGIFPEQQFQPPPMLYPPPSMQQCPGQPNRYSDFSMPNFAGSMSAGRYPRIKLPGYDGIDHFRNWICKCEQYFR